VIQVLDPVVQDRSCFLNQHVIELDTAPASEWTEAGFKTSTLQQYLIITSAFFTMRLPAETAVHIVEKSNHVRAWQSPF
jgi:hypothetical protein